LNTDSGFKLNTFLVFSKIGVNNNAHRMNLTAESMQKKMNSLT